MLNYNTIKVVGSGADSTIFKIKIRNKYYTMRRATLLKSKILKFTNISDDTKQFLIKNFL